MKRPLTLALCVAVAAATAAAALDPSGAPDDHFLCYKAKVTAKTPKFLATTLALGDAFESKDFVAKKVARLCTPAEKNQAPVVDATTHLVGYKIKRDKDEPKHVPQAGVGVFDQFGGLSVDTITESFLLVPSAKDLNTSPPLPGPNAVDHFKCYKIKVTRQTPKFAGTTVSIADQFTATDAVPDGRKLLAVKTAKHLCLPVDKNGEGIKNPLGKLLCYKAKPAKDEPKHVPRTNVRVNNQLGALTVDTKKEAELCLPSIFMPSMTRETVDIPSPAEPPDTPGTSGVVVTNPKLLTQFGGGSFTLNRARYTRYHYDVGGAAPNAILVLVPGFEGGAGGFKILAENLLRRALVDHGLVIEVWAYDRRTNQLEDLAGSDIAESLGDPQVALDWYFGGELGLTLHPALAAGPNRRAVFYNTSSDIPFLANWTPLVFSRDIDTIVQQARAAAQNQNVFLGGHSAGTGFAARYAATDFNLSGVGPADPGYAKLRGLVLIEGGGGSTGGTPPTADTLDRIEAKFDGGLFGAVRDGAPRCVDGTTPCSIATEAIDCVGQVPPKCTPQTTSYSVFLGLLNPRIFAAVEPSAIQGRTDPDSGQVIIQVDQGSPGNNAVDVVPDLAPLKGFPVSLPPATVEGAIGTFLDDDGLVGNTASFISTSVGAVGPTVGPLTTWLDSSEGPFGPATVPNNGPKPTTLPGGRWGQEKEVTYFPRLLTTFYDGGTNFVDWYYPSSGLSVTSVSGICTMSVCTTGNVGASCSSGTDCSQSINLDSTALSVGRGRRDIENLTQAASIDIPVIGLGGSNGLTPVTGSYVAFAQSIAPCTAPSCDGTPRVVDASMPNPAFPTYGDANGGFEVYVSEGLSHVDVLTAEDNADNHVVGPLAAFLARNAQ
jgi:pimeloyl-ACP methyl ester carboxylesterase